MNIPGSALEFVLPRDYGVNAGETDMPVCVPALNLQARYFDWSIAEPLRLVSPHRALGTGFISVSQASSSKVR